uniref:PNPLA domain-containing protein n=1 Tax=viral metagenome TaxID=1070528 RepID=A0A6C0EZJ1_9ZZZZ
MTTPDTTIPNIPTPDTTIPNIPTPDTKIKISHIKHLVLSGGGFLGISYIGLIKYMEDNLPNPIINNFKSITGCSAGAMFGTLLAIGCTSVELDIIIKNMNFKEYLNINAESIINFMRLKGLESGKNLMNLIKKSIKDKTGDENITFSQIREKFNISLQIGVTNLTKSKFELMNCRTTPDTPIHIAIRASIALPFIFEPTVIGDDLFCDGGLLDNLPIENIIQQLENDTTITPDTTPDTISKKTIDASSILAIYLLTQFNTINKDNYQSSSVSHYLSSLIQALSNELINKKLLNININNEKYNEKHKQHKLIIYKIPCDVMTFVKINASHEDIDNIIDIAYNTTKYEFEK